VLKIAHILEATSGGAARAVMALAAEQSRLGHEVTLIYSPLRADALFRKDKDALKLKKIISLPMRREVGPYDVWSAWQLYRILKQEGPFDVLHGHSSKAGALTRLVGVFLRGVKVFYTPHGFISMNKEAAPLYRKIEKRLASLAHKIIVVSDAEKQHALDNIGIQEDRLALVHNGLSFKKMVSRGEARSRMGYSEQNRVFGFVGRMSAEKNPLRLIKAFAPLALQDSHLHLAILGSGPLLEAVKKEIARQGIGSGVRFWHDEDARFFIPGFDALVCSSDNEGFPLVFIEGLQNGVPLVSTPVGGTKECVLDNKTGFVAEDFTKESLSQALRRYLDLLPSTRKSMEMLAAAHGNNFTAEKMAKETLLLYQGKIINR